MRLNNNVGVAFMSKKFAITFSICIALFVALNALRLFSGPPARVGVSGWRTMGFPFPVRVENVQYTVAGPIVTMIRDGPWMWSVNVGVWLLLSYRFALWVERSGAAWWRRKAGKGHEHHGASYEGSTVKRGI